MLPWREGEPNVRGGGEELGAEVGLEVTGWDVDDDGEVDVRMAAAESRTEGTACSSCSVFLARGILCGSRGFPGWDDGEGGRSGSMSRSKIAEEDEWMLVGLLGILLGEPNPNALASPVRRC